MLLLRRPTASRQPAVASEPPAVASEPPAGIGGLLGAPASAARRLAAVSRFWRVGLGVDQPTSDRSRTIRMLFVRAWRRSSAWSRSVGGGSVDQRLPTSRISPDAASWRSRRSVLACCSPAALGDLAGGVLAVGQLAEHPSHAILAIRSPACGCGPDRVRGPVRGLGRLAGWVCGRRVSVTGSTGSAHDHRLVTVAPYNRELAPVAPATANGAPPPGTVDGGKFLRIQTLHCPHDR